MFPASHPLLRLVPRGGVKRKEAELPPQRATPRLGWLLFNSQVESSRDTFPTEASSEGMTKTETIGSCVLAPPTSGVSNSTTRYFGRVGLSAAQTPRRRGQRRRCGLLNVRLCNEREAFIIDHTHHLFIRLLCQSVCKHACDRWPVCAGARNSKRKV